MPAPTHAFTSDSKYLKWPMYGLALLLLLALLSTIFFFSGAAIALPIIGTWFLGMNTILASILAAGFITAIISIAISTIYLALNKISSMIFTRIAPLNSMVLSNTSLSEGLSAALKIKPGASLNDEKDDAAVKLLKSHLETNLEEFVQLVLTQFSTHKGICHALNHRGTLVKVDNSLPLPLDTSEEELKDIFAKLNDSTGQITTVSTYKLLDYSRMQTLLTNDSISNNLIYDALQFMVASLIHEILLYKVERADIPASIEQSSKLQAVAINLVKNWAQKKYSADAPRDNAHYSQPLASLALNNDEVTSAPSSKYVSNDCRPGI